MILSVESFETGSTHHQDNASSTCRASAKNMPCMYIMNIL